MNQVRPKPPDGLYKLEYSGGSSEGMHLAAHRPWYEFNAWGKILLEIRRRFLAQAIEDRKVKTTIQAGAQEAYG